MRTFKALRGVTLAMGIAAAMLLMIAPGALAKTKPEKKHRPTFTEFESSTPGCLFSECQYLTPAGTPFSVTAFECTWYVDTDATGTMVFKDATTHRKLGSASLVPSRYTNCSEASITDTEELAVGNYTITASYKPGGTNPYPKSKGSLLVEVLPAP